MWVCSIFSQVDLVNNDSLWDSFSGIGLTILVDNGEVGVKETVPVQYEGDISVVGSQLVGGRDFGARLGLRDVTLLGDVDNVLEVVEVDVLGGVTIWIGSVRYGGGINVNGGIFDGFTGGTVNDLDWSHLILRILRVVLGGFLGDSEVD